MPLENAILDTEMKLCKTIKTPSKQEPLVKLPDVHSNPPVIDYFSQNGDEHLIVRLNDPELNRYVDEVKAHLNGVMGGEITCATGFNPDNLEKFLLNLITYVSLNPHFAPNTSSDRTDYYKKHRDGVNLSELSAQGLFMCRERSMMLHILLAEYGFISCIVYGRKPNFVSNKMDSHEWVACKCVTPSKKLLSFVLDPSYGNLRQGEYCENYDYTFDIMWFSVVKPRKINGVYPLKITPQKSSIFDD